MALAPAGAQELRRQPIPFTVWLDFHAMAKPNAPRLALPIWLESVASEHPKRLPREPLSTIFRLRLRRMGALNPEIHLRLYFEDHAQAAPRITGWTEIGELNYQSGPLGAGLGLTNSADVLIPTRNIDYLEIAIPGDGSDIHGAFLSTATHTEAKTAVDFARPFEFMDPFGRMAESLLGPDDSYLFGRVRAALLAPATKLPPEEPIVLDFQLDRAPLLAVIAFEVLNADIAEPPGVCINNRTLGQASPRLPDLADPGYRGQIVAAQMDVRYRYAGWLRCEKIIPASSLVAGVNRLSLFLPRFARPVAVRALEIQLKYPYEGRDTASP
jgi:hypothetical protein